MATRNVVLSQHQHELVESLVKAGRYQNASEVLRDGLRLLERRELEEKARLLVLHEAAQQGWSDLASGRFDDVADENLDDFIGQIGARAAKNKPADQTESAG
jgi:antitoxin ParD1/3/4